MKHEIIYRNNYALIVSDGEIKEGDWFINTVQNELYCHNIEHYDVKKVIAHRPLTDVPILEGVPLLPEFSEEDSNKELYFQKQVMNPYTTGGQSYTAYEKGFIEGWSKAKETYKYTEEDMIKCVVAHAKYTDSLRNGRPNFSMWISSHQGKSFLQSLQQPKRPKYFECQMSPMNLDEIRENGKGFLHTNTNKMVVITNSQGQTELVGEYIYE